MIVAQSNKTDAGSRECLHALQGEALEAIACGTALKAVAELLCARVEDLAPAVVCSILSVDAQGLLRPLAAPSLPDDFSQALDGVPIGPCVGSCGATASRDEAVEVVDIDADPLWVDSRALALPLGLLACWSSPIKARDGRVVGTFAFYYRTRRGPSDLERQIVATCVHLCAIAIEHDATQSRVYRLAFHDSLTGLPNRTSFRDQAAERLTALPAAHTALLASIDLDDYKGVNEALGHRAGDRLLKEIADRLLACAGEHAVVGRSGGDRFMILQTVADERADAAPLARTLMMALDAPFLIDGQKVLVGACIGLAQASFAAMPMAELARQVEVALYEAKSAGPRSWRIYVPDMAAAVRSRRSFKRDLRNAIDAGDFSLTYQPIVVLASNELVGVETLLRWQDPLRGGVSPTEFIPVVEEMGLIGVLGDWVLREACKAAASWPRAITLGVNLSPLQFRKRDFVQDVVGVLHETGLEPHRLDLEVTETALLARDVPTRTALYELHDRGVRLSLDDFGTGFSSLLSLRSFPFDKLKIDMSFVRGLGVDADSTAIIRAVIGLARDLGIRTVAEGVETREQCEWLTRHGCNEGQGYYFGKPMAGADLQALLGRPGRCEELIAPQQAPSHTDP